MRLCIRERSHRGTAEPDAIDCAVEPIREIGNRATQARDERRNLAAMAIENGKPRRAVQLRQSEIFLNQALNSARVTTELIHIGRRQ
jgi:hypothetical protein